MANTSKTILVIGGAGAQNSAVVRELSKNEAFNIKVLARDIKNEICQELAALPRVTLVQGDCYTEEALLSGFQGVDACFVNTNGFAIGEKAEIFWGLRMYEIAYWAGTKHFIYSSLPYVSKKSGFNPKYRVPFVDGKAKVAEYLRAQPTDVMNWSLLESGPYADSHLGSTWAPKKGEDGVYTFRMPLGPTGAQAFVSLTDLGWFARYMFENPEEFKGDLLSVGIEHGSGDDVAAAFTAVTGLPARYDPLPLEVVTKPWTHKVGLDGSPGYEDPTLWTLGEQMTDWFGIWAESGGNKGLWTKDYDRLDRIYPGRLRTVEQWMRSVGYSTVPKPNPLQTDVKVKR